MTRSLSVLALLVVLMVALPAFSQAAVDLRISKSSPNPVVVGLPFQYTLVINNDGPSTATLVQAFDVLPAVPAQMTATSAVPSQGSCPTIGTTVGCSLGTIAAGGSATILITTSAPIVGDYTNTASVENEGPQAESDSSDNTATFVTTARLPAPGIPTAGTWGLIALTALLVTGAILRLRH